MLKWSSLPIIMVDILLHDIDAAECLESVGSSRKMFVLSPEVH